MNTTINHYERYNGSYTQQKMLEMDQENLSTAIIKLNRGMNPASMKTYTDEVEHLEVSIKARIKMLTTKEVVTPESEIIRKQLLIDVDIPLLVEEGVLTEEEAEGLIKATKEEIRDLLFML